MTVKEKQNVTLPCKAAAFLPPVITWYKDGDVIEEEKRQFKKRNLEIKEIQFEDRGVYTCTAENLLGRIRTSVNVTVKGNIYSRRGVFITWEFQNHFNWHRINI